MNDTAIEVYNGTQISLHRPPEDILAEATKAANALTTVLQNKPNKVMFNGEQYLEREDWGTVARFYGCTAKVVATRYVTFGDVYGWEAEAVCIDRNLNEIGRAESMCLSDEDNWGDVPVYEWKDVLDKDGKKIWQEPSNGRKGRYKAEKILVGTKPKPQFQIRSMAQTRAEAKALKSVFGWVVVLAGFKTTPAEEMTGDENGHDDERDEREQVQQPTRASEKQQGPELVEIMGPIESAKLGKDGAVWFVLDKKTVMVKEELVQDTMAVGGKMHIRAIRKASEKMAEWYFTVEVLKADPPEGGIGGGGGAPQAASAEEQAAFAEQLDPDAAKDEVNLSDLVESGQVKKASEIEAPKKGVIGSKDAGRIYAAANQNKNNNHGLKEADIKKIIAQAPLKLESLSDLPKDQFDNFMKIARGDIDWRPMLQEE